MKLSVSLPEEDVAILDEFARTAGLSSRSAALHHAVRMLRLPDLEQDYEAAWQEWEASGDPAAWGVTATDGMVDASR
jgi:Arc/MetJ-type ribon-helix-helix transcriptional regulator